MRSLVPALLDAGFSVKLCHIAEKTGMSWEEHGFVVIRHANGTELARDDKFQHNRNYRACMDGTAAKPLVKAVTERHAQVDATEGRQHTAGELSPKKAALA